MPQRVRGTLANWRGIPLLFVGAVCGCVTPTERPLLWMIQRDPPSFLYGTIHLPDERVLAVPPVVLAALRASDTYYAELSLAGGQNDKVDEWTRLAKGQTVHDVLPPELYQRTRRYFRSRGMSLGPLEDRKIWFITVTLSILDYLPQFLLRPPLDQHLWRIAKSQGKELGGLEEVEEQLAVFESMTTAQQIAQLEFTLSQCEQARAAGIRPARRLVAVYLRGDEAELLAEVNTSFAAPDPNSPAAEANAALAERIVHRRNEVLAERVIARLESSPQRRHFFAIGAGHLVGPDGILARLNDNGYKTLRFGPGDLPVIRELRPEH